ncbi:MAG: hypothetical protein ACW9XH_06670 [Candidatus Nitrosopumilus sp. bin_32a]
MAEKKAKKETVKKTPSKKTPSKKTPSKAKSTKDGKSKVKSKKYIDEPSGDAGIVIVDDDIVIDQEKVNEERRAYLEESRSQEASSD